MSSSGNDLEQYSGRPDSCALHPSRDLDLFNSITHRLMAEYYRYLSVGIVLCALRCLLASLASTHWILVAFLFHTPMSQDDN